MVQWKVMSFSTILYTRWSRAGHTIITYSKALYTRDMCCSTIKPGCTSTSGKELG